MIQSLSKQQLNLLRRCDGGLRVWESGRALESLLVDLGVLCHLKLVLRDEVRGYELTAAGEALLARLGR